MSAHKRKKQQRVNEIFNALMPHSFSVTLIHANKLNEEFDTILAALIKSDDPSDVILLTPSSSEING